MHLINHVYFLDAAAAAAAARLLAVDLVWVDGHRSKVCWNIEGDRGRRRRRLEIHLSGELNRRRCLAGKLATWTANDGNQLAW